MARRRISDMVNDAGHDVGDPREAMKEAFGQIRETLTTTEDGISWKLMQQTRAFSRASKHVEVLKNGHTISPRTNKPKPLTAVQTVKRVIKLLSTYGVGPEAVPHEVCERFDWQAVHEPLMTLAKENEIEPKVLAKAFGLDAAGRHRPRTETDELEEHLDKPDNYDELLEELQARAAEAATKRAATRAKKKKEEAGKAVEEEEEEAAE